MIDGKSIIPKYYQLKEILLAYIDEKQMQEGAPLPSENELIKKHNVSRNTVRQALNVLEQEKIIYKVQGKGTFLGQKPVKDSSRSYILGVLTPVTTKSIYPEIINGIEHAAHEQNYQILWSNSQANPVKEQESLEAMLNKGIDGLIVEPALSGRITEDSYIYQRLASLSIPVVVMDCCIQGLERPCITLADRNYGYHATKYLIDNGHKRIAFIYKNEVIAGKQRYEGYAKALLEAELPLDPELAVAFTEEEDQKGIHPVSQITKDLLGSNNPPTAIFYFNDENAFEGIQTITQLGYKIPDDLSVIGIDDSSFATLGNTELTTLKHPKEKMGQQAAEMIINEINKPGSIANRCILIEPELIIRNTVRCIK